MVERLVKEEGLTVGGSTGVNVVAALRVAARADLKRPGRHDRGRPVGPLPLDAVDEGVGGARGEGRGLHAAVHAEVVRRASEASGGLGLGGLHHRPSEART